jgi:DNA-binding SARP family transcriptional activator/tetratricopeptide (TPR) repeat protein/TolB-like protein
VYSLRLLGAPSLEGPDGYVRGHAVQPRQMAVLAVIAAAEDTGITRDKLTGLLWPEIPDDAARHTLRDALYLLRGTLGEGTIAGNGGILRINRDRLWTDVGAFRDDIAAGDLEAAVELCRGPFLDGFYSRHGVDFELWVDATRKELARQYEEALTSLAHAAEQSGNHSAAVAWWRRLVDHDPPNTRFAVGLIKALAASGDPGNAMLSVHEHERILKDEFGVPPPPELKALEAALSRESSTEVEVPDIVAAGYRPPPAPVVAAQPRQRSRKWAGWVAAVAGVGLAAAWLLGSRMTNRAEYRSDLVVVAPFANRTGDPELDVYGTLVSDWIIHGVQQRGVADVVPALTVERLWRDPGGSEGTGDPVQFLAQATGGALIVHGAYYVTGDSIRFQADLADANAGAAGVSVEPAVALRDDALAAVGQLRERVLGALAASIQPIGAVRAGLMTPPPSLDVYRAWREGEEAFLRQHWTEALDRFRRAWSMDTTFLTPLVRSGWVLCILERYASLDTVLMKARQHRRNLSTHETLQIDWMEAFRRRDMEEQARIAVATAALTPTDWSFNAGASTLRLGRLGDAVRYLKQLNLALTFDEGVMVLMYLARAQHLLGEFQTELETAQQAHHDHPDRLAPWEGEVRALVALGSMTEADSLVASRVILPAPYPNLPPASAVWSTSGSVLTYLALEARAHGRSEAYREWIERAIEWHRQRIAEGADIDPMGLVRALYYGGRWREAEDYLETLSANDPGNVEYVGLRAVLAARLGELDQEARLDRELALLDTWLLSGANLWWRARIAALLGEKRRAVELLHQAYRNGWPYNIWNHVELDFDTLADYRPFQEFMAPKG